MKRLYLDNPVVRDLTQRPEILKDCYEHFIQTFGRTFKVTRYCYLFFEFFGFKKDRLEILPEMLKWDFSRITGNPNNDENMVLIDQICEKGIESLRLHINGKLISLHELLKESIERRLSQISAFHGAQEMEGKLFGGIRDLFKENFIDFVLEATRYLVWDVFCGICPIGLSTGLFRQRQLGHWYRAWKQGIVLPIGKIIDDHSRYYEISFSSYFKNFEDMVDAEMLTYVIFGFPSDGGEIERCDSLTYDMTSSVSERVRLALGTITNLENSLKRNIRYKSGKAYFDSIDCTLIA